MSGGQLKGPETSLLLLNPVMGCITSLSLRPGNGAAGAQAEG